MYALGGSLLEEIRSFHKDVSTFLIVNRKNRFGIVMCKLILAIHYLYGWLYERDESYFGKFVCEV